MPKKELVDAIEIHLRWFYCASEYLRDAYVCDTKESRASMNKHIKKMAHHAAILTELRAQLTEIKEDEKTLAEEVAELREIDPTGWREVEDPLKALQNLRYGDENAGA